MMQKNDAAIPFPVIAAAVNGDIDAINAVVKSYEVYIARLSTRILYDNDRGKGIN